MATKDNTERIQRLTVYAANLNNRLKGDVPPKHKDSPTGFKQMLEIDLKKTLDTIEKLKGG